MIKKVFISYSWSSPEHEDWVLLLAQRLVNDGIDVALDKWDLKEGHDKFHFMETMVKSNDINKVLIILDKKYSQKADSRTGGVGTETLIITPQIYQNTSQEKFVPIVAELDESGMPYLPTFLNGRIYIDLSSTEHYEINYEKLIRNILERPSLSKPKLGTPPKYLNENTPMSFKTTTIVRGFDAQIDKYPDRINSIARDFFIEFHNNLTEFTNNDPSNLVIDLGKQILDKLNQYTPLRDDYIQFIDKLTKNSNQFDTDILIRFFENLPLLLAPSDENVMSWSSNQYSHFKFIIYELFLYTVTVALKNENYNFLEDLFHSKYLVKDRYQRSNEPESFTVFYHHYDVFDAYYKQLTGGNFVSVQAELIIKRMPESLVKSSIVQADLLCYYIGQLTDRTWFPKTYVYKSSYENGFDFFNRLISKKHFDKVKGVLGVENIEQLKQKLIKLKDQDTERGYNYARNNIQNINSFIKVEDIATSK